MSDQTRNAGNEGDVMRHPALQSIVDHLSLDKAEALLRYFADQGAKTVVVGLGDNDAKWVKACLRHWWDEAEKIEKDLVMVIRADSWKCARCLWDDEARNVPDLVFVDPFKLNEPKGQPAEFLSSLEKRKIPFMCWTPLNCPSKWQVAKWSFTRHEEKVGNKGAHEFFKKCMDRKYKVVACCWTGSAGHTQAMYGCQLTFGHIFDAGFTASVIWQIDDGNTDPRKPGCRWWDKYNATINVLPQGQGSSSRAGDQSDHEAPPEGDS